MANNKVEYGVEEPLSLPLEGLTVDEALEKISEFFEIPSNPKVLLDGEETDGDDVVCNGDAIEIVKASGKKG